MRSNPVWISAREIVRWKHLSHERQVRALLVDLEDPSLAPLLDLAATPWDEADAQRPLAGARTYFLKRRALLRRLTGLWLDCDAASVVITHDSRGAPRVVTPQGSTFVSVSARGSFAALAVADMPVGVDIELREEPREPVWHILHPRERGRVTAEWRERRDDLEFMRVWIAKEAYLKALGIGFKANPAMAWTRFDGGSDFEVIEDVEPHRASKGVYVERPIGGRMVLGACLTL